MCLTYRVRIDERVLAMFDLCPPDIGSVSKDVRRLPIFPKNRDFTLRLGGQIQMVVRPISKLSEEGPL
jgi:hypothetical protein